MRACHTGHALAAMVSLVMLPAPRAWAKTQEFADNPNWWKKDSGGSVDGSRLSEPGQDL